MLVVCFWLCALCVRCCGVALCCDAYVFGVVSLFDVYVLFAFGDACLVFGVCCL